MSETVDGVIKNACARDIALSIGLIGCGGKVNDLSRGAFLMIVQERCQKALHKPMK